MTWVKVLVAGRRLRVPQLGFNLLLLLARHCIMSSSIWSNSTNKLRISNGYGSLEVGAEGTLSLLPITPTSQELGLQALLAGSVHFGLCRY